MWHICHSSARPIIGLSSLFIRQRPIILLRPTAPQRLFSFPSFLKSKTTPIEPLPQPPVNPRHPPDYIPPRSLQDATSARPIQSQSSIFARFRQAYSKYGKTLLAVHFISSFAWFSGLILLHFNGFDLGIYVIDAFERIGIISSERRLSFIRRMNEFSISRILSKIPFIPQERLDSLNQYWTGERLRLLATALLLYKFLTPIRYAFTLGVTAYVSRAFVRRGIFKPTPQGDSLQELYRDQKQLIKSHVRRAREKIKSSSRRGLHKPG